MALSEQQESFYRELERTMETPGWAFLIQGWKQEMESLPDTLFFNAQNVEDIRAARIRYELLHELVGLAETLRQQREQLKQGDDNVEVDPV